MPHLALSLLGAFEVHLDGRSEEVANLFAFLASDEASFMPGESVVIDGGQLSVE